MAHPSNDVVGNVTVDLRPTRGTVATDYVRGFGTTNVGWQLRPPPLPATTGRSNDIPLPAKVTSGSGRPRRDRPYAWEGSDQPVFRKRFRFPRDQSGDEPGHTFQGNQM